MVAEQGAIAITANHLASLVGVSKKAMRSGEEAEITTLSFS